MNQYNPFMTKTKTQYLNEVAIQHFNNVLEVEDYFLKLNASLVV